MQVLEKFDNCDEKISFINTDDYVELYFKLEVFNSYMIVDNAHISFINEKFAIIDNHDNNISIPFEKGMLDYDSDYIIRILEVFKEFRNILGLIKHDSFVIDNMKLIIKYGDCSIYICNTFKFRHIFVIENDNDDNVPIYHDIETLEYFHEEFFYHSNMKFVD